MRLEKIITLANKKVQVQFAAMERSLRATGCRLPLWVIPYDENKFELPENAIWWEDKGLFEWLDSFDKVRLPPKLNLARKYLCLTEKNYHFLDTDIIILINPEEVMLNHSGFIVADGHWHSQSQTFTSNSLRLLKKNTTIWQKKVFNSGQFACDKILYNKITLQEVCKAADFIDTCIYFEGLKQKHEQPGLNMLVNNACIQITNLTLPPYDMESTWAGDYNDEYEKYWKEESSKPYLIHWAGLLIDGSRKIDDLFIKYLNVQERILWKML
jgi:hypothetical protein